MDMREFIERAGAARALGVIVTKNGKETARYLWDDACRRNIYSASKSFTSAAVGIALREGLLSLDEKLVDAFEKDLPDTVSPHLEKACVRDLLTMCLGQEKPYLMGSDRPFYTETDWVRAALARPFSDDPGVVGKWELCGELHDKNDPSKVDPDVSVFAHKEIPFLPGGAYVWIWFWTKGVLYRILANGGIAVPNPYRIVDKNGEKYMIIEYIGDDCIDDGGDPVYLLYKQTDTTPYTDKTIRKRIDNTDIPYVDDPDVLGAWEAVDFVKTANDFDIKKPKSDKKDLWLMYIRFLPRGICVKTVKTDRAPADIVLRYTKDFVLCDSELTAEKYVIKNTDGADHLFLQHKSGDYSYGGLEPLLYVFKRKEVKHE